MIEPEVIKEQKSEALSLNISEKTIADIVLNFLGNKQVLSYYLEDESFLISQFDLEQFYYYLKEKVDNTHHSSLQYFTVSVQYNDDTSKEFVGIDNLSRFLETLDVVPKSVTLSWNIILNFPTAHQIENQKIELSFNILSDKKTQIFLRIEHTNQGWGLEVLHL